MPPSWENGPRVSIKKPPRHFSGDGAVWTPNRNHHQCATRSNLINHIEYTHQTSHSQVVTLLKLKPETRLLQKAATLSRPIFVAEHRPNSGRTAMKNIPSFATDKEDKKHNISKVPSVVSGLGLMYSSSSFPSLAPMHCVSHSAFMLACEAHKPTDLTSKTRENRKNRLLIPSLQFLRSPFIFVIHVNPPPPTSDSRSSVRSSRYATSFLEAEKQT